MSLAEQRLQPGWHGGQSFCDGVHSTAGAEGGEDLVRADTDGNLKEHGRASQETDGV